MTSDPLSVLGFFIVRGSGPWFWCSTLWFRSDLFDQTTTAAAISNALSFSQKKGERVASWSQLRIAKLYKELFTCPLAAAAASSHHHTLYRSSLAAVSRLLDFCSSAFTSVTFFVTFQWPTFHFRFYTCIESSSYNFLIALEISNISNFCGRIGSKT